MLIVKRQTGFTIVELLIVIVVIAVLATISIVAYNGIQQRARDSKRAQDLASIKKALLLYNIDHGGVKKTASYAGSGPGGWNISSMANWLTFLTSEYGAMPVDPVNTGVADPNGSYELTYFYYCYNAGSGPLPATPNVRVGYWSEVGKKNTDERFPVEQCL